ncbi:hypothetical protein [Defluviitalea phaphyphila]|uniref:hypothetical protein n=1 Tax=Defluviitalea phaphyphila TaxID=1473580 RepID=UPI00073182DC|nr:hypothetical protein [Defluviitalea phaphyphila]
MIKIQYKICVSIIVMILFFVGCSTEVSNLTDFESSNNLQQNVQEQKEDTLKVELTRFFRQYFTPDEKTILTLNTYPIKVDESYWEEYEDFKEASLELLQGFISPNLEEKIQKQFLTTNVHFPRFVEINGNVIIGYGDVEDVSYDLIEKNENNIILTAYVNVKGTVITKERFNQIYSYDSSKNYYTIKNNDIIEDEKDEIKVQCSYIVELEQINDNKIYISSIKENSELSVPEKNRRSIINNEFVKRIDYLDAPNTSDEQLIKLFFNQFMNQDKDAYNYYQYAYDMNYNTYVEMLNDLGLKDYMLLEKADYKNQFPKTIIPTKDDILSLNISKEDINIFVHIDTSKKLRKYIVEIPAEVELSDYNMDNMMYQYLVTIKNNGEQGPKIKNIKYVFIKSIEDEEKQENS